MSGHMAPSGTHGRAAGSGSCHRKVVVEKIMLLGAKMLKTAKIRQETLIMSTISVGATISDPAARPWVPVGAMWSLI